MRPALAVLAVILSLPAAAKELHVPAAFPTIQAAVDASVTGDTIVVAPGTYREATDLKSRRITLKSSAGAQATVLDGATLTQSILTAKGAETLATVVQGFTFRNGPGTRTNACGSNGLLGGAIFVVNAGLTIVDCVFEDNGTEDAASNFSITAGGAVMACRSDLSMAGSRFERNHAVFGGALNFDTRSSRGADLSVRSTTFRGNSSAFGGAAKTLLIEDSVARYENTTFTANRAPYGGALQTYGTGASSLTVANCHFEGGEATHAGALYVDTFSSARASISDSTFIANTASAFAGAVFLHSAGDSRTELLRCDLRENKAGFAGGLYAMAYGNLPDDPGGRIVISGSRFVDNSIDPTSNTGLNSPCFLDGLSAGGNSVYYGAGADLRTQTGGQIVVANSVFAGNSGVRDGGGGAHAGSCEGGTIDFVNCTMVGNHPSALHVRLGTSRFPDTSGSGSIRVANSIVRENREGGAAFVVERQDASSTADITFSNVQGGFAGSGNIDIPPAFVDAARGDYRLREGSAGIDAGDNAAAVVVGTTDAAGRQRFADDPRTRDTGLGAGPVIDMGAFELVPEALRRRVVRKTGGD